MTWNNNLYFNPYQYRFPYSRRQYRDDVEDLMFTMIGVPVSAAMSGMSLGATVGTMIGVPVAYSRRQSASDAALGGMVGMGIGAAAGALPALQSRRKSGKRLSKRITKNKYIKRRSKIKNN